MSALGDVAGYARLALPLVPGASRLPWVAGGGGDMPDLERTTEAATDRERLAAYRRVCGFAADGDAVPATWPHVLAWPLHVSLMADGRFPLPAVGLVHIANRIEQRRPVRASETLALVARTGPLEPHPKGRTFTLRTEARVDDELVWSETSTMLRRGRGAEDAERDDALAPLPDDLEPEATWTAESDLGRRYAAVSGDRNPIHMADLTAKAFGFPRAIAHGMWTAARSLAQLADRAPEAFTFDVRFRAPIVLPATVAFAVREEAGATRFAVRDAGGGRRHLDGVLEPEPGSTAR